MTGRKRIDWKSKVEEIDKAIAKGMTKTEAAKQAGVAPSGYYVALERLKQKKRTRVSKMVTIETPITQSISKVVCLIGEPSQLAEIVKAALS